MRPELVEVIVEPGYRFAFTSRVDGDFAVELPPGEVEHRRRALVDHPWTWLKQVHGADVMPVNEPGQHAGAVADAAVTNVPGAVLAVQTADCAAVLMVGSDVSDDVIAVGAAHAGWRGLELEVLQNTVGALRTLGAERVRWRLGPCISAAEYEFGGPDLDRLSHRYGPSVRALTSKGRPAFDLRAGVRAAMAEADAEECRDGKIPCTAQDRDYFSWRANRDSGRQTAAIWMSEREC